MRLRIAIFGAGISGQAAKRLARALGHEVTLFDEAGCGDAERFSEDNLAEFDRFIFSPGFAADHPWRRCAASSGRKLQSELSFAAEHWQGRLIGVTGTNGKTTLTRLLTEAFVHTGKNAVATGNIGQPLSAAVLDAAHDESSCAVCEISSFQAELSSGMQLDALLWTNFAEDHLDRYPTMRDYFMAKARLFQCLRCDAICVVGPQVLPWCDLLDQALPAAAHVAGMRAFISQLAPDSVFTRQPFSENFALAAEFWSLAGEPAASLLAAARDFKLEPHRLDVVAEKDGVRYWNDSKATNFHSVLAAVEAVPGPIIWIGGGQTKGGDMAAFAAALSKQIDVAVLYGEAAPQLGKELMQQLKNVQIVSEFGAAVQIACEFAGKRTPSNVLLSPGFASFDQFQSYAERGKTFNSMVLSL